MLLKMVDRLNTLAFTITMFSVAVILAKYFEIRTTLREGSKLEKNRMLLLLTGWEL